MAELADYCGERIKIGTCEDLYYLRADQARSVSFPHPWELFRFRFPFPDEDHITPGAFEDYDRGVRVLGMHPGEGVEHYRVQLKSDIGYLASISCPEAHQYRDQTDRSRTVVDGLTVARNGFNGGVRLYQQRLIDGLLVAVVGCSCGARWRLPTLEYAQPLLDALAAMDGYEREDRLRSSWHHDDVEPYAAREQTFPQQIAERVLEGYDRDYVAALEL
jgi:hypothetical protein